MSEEDIQEYFFSKDAISILNMIQGIESQHPAHPANIKNHILTNFTPDEMLRTKRIRELLLDSLNSDEASDLLQIMNVTTSSNDDIYALMRKIKFNKKNYKKLFGFFDEEYHDEKHHPDNTIHIPKDMEVACVKRHLFGHQRQAFHEIRKYLNSDKRRCILHMPTGSGKTTTAMRVVSSHFLNSDPGPTLVIWLAYNDELCEQAIEEFKETWSHVGDRSISILRYFRGHTPKILDKTKSEDIFVVASLRKIHESDKKHNVFLSTLADRVNFVIMDEAHQAPAPTHKNILQQLTEKRSDVIRLLGLSATPGRGSGNKDLPAFFNHKKVTLRVSGYENPMQYLINKQHLAKPNVTLIRSNSNLTPEDLKKIKKSLLDIPEDILKKIGQDRRRTLKVIGQIQDLIESGHKRIIVFAPSLKNSRDISMILTALGHKSFHVDGGTSSVTRMQYIRHYKDDTDETMIMCNFGVFTAGFDAPKTSAAVIARPTKSMILYSQMVGRAMRGLKVGGNKECEIRTITDIRLRRFTDLVDGFFSWEDIW